MLTKVAVFVVLPLPLVSFGNLRTRACMLRRSRLMRSCRGRPVCRGMVVYVRRRRELLVCLHLCPKAGRCEFVPHHTALV